MTEISFIGSARDSHFYEGAQSARALILNVQRMVAEASRTGSDFDVQAVAMHIQIAAGCRGQRFAGFTGALADFLGSTLEGCPPSPDKWNPMERLSSGAGY